MWFVLLLIAFAAAAQEQLPAIENLIASGQFRAALEKLEQQPAKDARWHFLASKAFDGLNEPARAVAEAEAALALEPANEAYHHQLAQIFLSRNTPLAALEIYTEAEPLFPASILIRLGKGIALKELQRYKEAESELNFVLDKRPDFGLAFETLATVYLQSQNYEAVIRRSESYAAGQPMDFRGYYYLAAGMDGLRRDPETIEELTRRSIELNPDFAASRALLGKVLLRGGRNQEAVEALSAAVRLRPDYAPAHLHLANAYQKAGSREKAAEHFQIVRELKEKERRPAPSLLYHRGDQK